MTNEEIIRKYFSCPHHPAQRCDCENKIKQCATEIGWLSRATPTTKQENEHGVFPQDSLEHFIWQRCEADEIKTQEILDEIMKTFGQPAKKDISVDELTYCISKTFNEWECPSNIVYAKPIAEAIKQLIDGKE